MINKNDEEKAFKIAMHTELEWQKLKAKINSEKSMENTELKEGSMWKGIYKWLDWKPLSLGITYTAVVVIATIKIIPVLVPTEKDINYPKVKSSDVQIVQNNNCQLCYFPITAEIDELTKKESLEMKVKLESFGIEVYHKKLAHNIFILEAKLPKILPQELLDFWSKEKSTNTELKSNCKIKLIFITFKE